LDEFASRLPEDAKVAIKASTSGRLNKQAQQRVPSVGIHSECDAQKLYLIKYKSYSFRKAYRKRKT